MNLSFITLVTDEPPRVKLEGVLGQIPEIKFGNASTGTLNVQLPSTMTPDQQAAWLLGFAKDATDLAASIQHRAATVPA